jgi:hypothetical protein
MRVFAKVVESGSFTGAEARLGISASMVGQHVKELFAVAYSFMAGIADEPSTSTDRERLEAVRIHLLPAGRHLRT